MMKTRTIARGNVLTHPLGNGTHWYSTVVYVILGNKQWQGYYIPAVYEQS